MKIEKVTDGIYEAIGSIDGSLYTGFGTSHYEALEDCIARAVNAENPALN